MADGSLDYPDDLLKELEYTVCSIHSRFSMNKGSQTERILRTMDKRYFNILGHATWRRLLKRPGYEIDYHRRREHARKNGCFLRSTLARIGYDLSSTNARLVSHAGVKIAINTDAYNTGEFNFVMCGVEQARRAGLGKGSVLNCLPWAKLRGAVRKVGCGRRTAVGNQRSVACVRSDCAASPRRADVKVSYTKHVHPASHL